MNILPLCFKWENNGWAWVCPLWRGIRSGNGLFILSLQYDEVFFEDDDSDEQFVLLPI
jgi:hypothetical protein